MATEGGIGGLEGVIDQLRKVDRTVRLKLARSAGRKGANVVRDAARSGFKALDRSGTKNKIYEQVAVQFAGRYLKRTGDLMFRVGIRGGAKQYKNTTENRRKRRVGGNYEVAGSVFYWRFLELGTSRIAARPVLVPAASQNQGKVFAAMAAEYERGFTKLGKGVG